MRFPLPQLFSVATAVALLAGTVAVQMLTGLPPLWITLVLTVVALALIALPSRWRWLGYVLLGAAWTIWRADLTLSARLPAALEGEDIVVTGAVLGLPYAQDDATRFDLAVAAAERDGQRVPVSGTLRLHWYASEKTVVPDIEPCSRWRVHVRLKRPRGLIDPGAFDFERYALAEGITATGYVREDALNAATGERRFCVERLRRHISQGIADTLGPGPQSNVLRALAFGDQRAMDEHEWNVARATGIPHLIAISGLHIALFAGFGVLLVRLLWKLAPRLTLRWPAPLIEALASIAFALGYAAISGLGLPTRRALVMIGMLLAANLMRRARAPVHGLAFAVIALLAFDPLCVLSAGFWLSFVGVAWLMFCLGGRGERRSWWREMISAQGVASLGLLPLTIWFFGQSSLIGPLANLIAVPVVCFLILPFGVAGAVLQLAVPALGAPLLTLAGYAMLALWQLLEQIADWPGALWYFPEPSIWAFALAMLGAAWLLLPRGMPARGLGLVLFLPLLVPARHVLADGEFEALMLDVGQGLSVVVRTRDHTLVYDAGARFPSGFDLGEAAVVPALHAIGVIRVDRLIVSHGDNDHAGGAAAVLAAFPQAAVSGGEPERLHVAATQCLAGEAWNWNGVAFRIVHPHEPLSMKNNDRCCVLEVRSGDNALLLTGDITATVEGEVVSALAPIAAHTLLQVPHHGSKTSSSTAFIDATRPELALVSSGYRNHFNHPNPAIVGRYRAAGVSLLDTPRSGFADFRFAADAAPRLIEQGRIDRHPYWRE
ncbi:DNA internalization-related competence protein ComEC/Rec2 [Rudaea sp.]|uniref:DNA internalization-related competence protein ComEC/Rec2 n=1 Tax=Rudaea sp. TaxID=2136325 RepID=UPI002ED509D8